MSTIADLIMNRKNNSKEYENVTPVDDDLSIAIRNIEEEQVSKSRGKSKAYEEPILGNFSMNPDYKEAPSISGVQNLYTVLKRYSKKNIILNSIINTRVNQVSLFCAPARYSDEGVGYEVRLKDPLDEPSSYDTNNMKKIERFLENTGRDKHDFTKDNFRTFVKKIVRDSLVYDKVNFEMIYDSQGDLDHFNAVDASTIYVAVDDNREEVKGKDSYKYVQVMDNRVIANFKPKEMAWEVRNPRTDVLVGRYGYPELEVALNHLQYHENTEEFNARYFSQGGTTRGLLHIKTGQEQSQQALQSFRREWSSMFSGTKGAWKIPVVTAEDVQFINMNQSSKDMEFEKWLNYLINVISSIYSIDPSEINFPNRGGATGNSGNTLNEGSAEEKFRNSKDKGLEPLLKFIEDTVNKYIISQFGDKYVFNFVGGDSRTETEIIDILRKKAEIGFTLNDVREELGKSDIKGGDVVLSGVHVQRLGQIMQEEQLEERKQREMEAEESDDENGDNSDTGEGTENEEDSLAEQTSYDGDLDDVNGKESFNQGVGRDGQMKGEENTNSSKQGGNGDND